jgi:hypothetical protein
MCAAARRQITEPSPSERIKLIALLDAWVAAVGSRKMLGGNEPNMADFAVYGALNSIEGVDTFKEVLEQVMHALLLVLSSFKRKETNSIHAFRTRFTVL